MASRFFRNPNVVAAISEGRESFVALAKFGSLFYVVHEYVVDVTTCIGPSMLPTFNVVGDVVVMERVSTNILKRYSRGDVVIAQSPTKSNQTVCKRIRAVAGDRVIIPTEQGRATGYKGHMIEIPPNHVWLEGDNALNSTDSRYYGPVPSAMVKGRVLFRIWPLPVGFVRNLTPVDEVLELQTRFKADPKLALKRDTREWLQRRSVVIYRENEDFTVSTAHPASPNSTTPAIIGEKLSTPRGIQTAEPQKNAEPSAVTTLAVADNIDPNILISSPSQAPEQNSSGSAGDLSQQDNRKPDSSVETLNTNTRSKELVEPSPETDVSRNRRAPPPSAGRDVPSETEKTHGDPEPSNGDRDAGSVNKSAGEGGLLRK